MAAGSTYTPIATTTLSTGTTSYTFSSVPTTYTDLVLVIRASNASSASYPKVRVGNGSVDSGSNYSRTYLSGTGSSAVSGRDTGTFYGISAYSDSDNNFAYVSIVNIMNYSNTTTYKTILARSNNAGIGLDAIVSLWRSTAAINTVNVLADTNFEAGTSFTLYGIAAA